MKNCRDIESRQFFCICTYGRSQLSGEAPCLFCEKARALAKKTVPRVSGVFVRTLRSFIRLTASFIASQLYSADAECYCPSDSFVRIK